MSNLLLKSRPLVVIPELAVRLGLNEAIVLQQIQYWLNDTASGVEIDGQRWIYNTLDKWKEQFPFFSESTIKRAFASLKNIGVLNIEQIKKASHDRTNYYSINYGHSLLSEQVKLTSSNRSKRNHRTGQIDPIEQVTLTDSNGSESGVSNGSDWPDLTETTTEITTEITTTNPCQVPAEPDEASDPALLVLEYFNRVTNSGFRDSKSTMGHIRARLGEDYVAADLMLVADCMTAKWANDSAMRDYLRPSTVFGIEKFGEYYELSRKWVSDGRPACAGGRWLKLGEVYVEIDTAERDETYRRLFSSNFKPENRIQELAARHKTRIGLLNVSAAMAAWRSVWKQAAEQAAKEQEAA
ncbi:MAG: conserved phage C-terminal domain-containing protein [Morganella sp. (in: enterobacteria)]